MRDIDEFLFEAIHRKDAAKVNALLADGADPNAKNNDGCTPLRLAVFKNRFDIVQILLEKGADIHTDDDAALREAMRNGYLDIGRYLVEQGADPNAKDENGKTPLHLAASKNRFDIAKVLRDAGAKEDDDHE